MLSVGNARRVVCDGGKYYRPGGQDPWWKSRATQAWKGRGQLGKQGAVASAGCKIFDSGGNQSS